MDNVVGESSLVKVFKVFEEPVHLRLIIFHRVRTRLKSQQSATFFLKIGLPLDPYAAESRVDLFRLRVRG